MYAQGVYTLTGPLLELVYEGNPDYDLELFSNCDVALDEILSPIYDVFQKVKSGRIPEYIAREVFEQKIAIIEKGYCPILSYFPEWDNFTEDGELNVDIFLEEEPSWSILTWGSLWRVLYPKPGSNHGFDPETIIEMAGEAVEFVAILDWTISTLTVVRSPYVGGRHPLGSPHQVDIADAEREGGTDTYVLPPDLLDEVLRSAVETIRCHRFHQDTEDVLTDEEALRRVENEYGHIPGSLPTRFIGVPEHAGADRLAKPHSATY